MLSPTMPKATFIVRHTILKLNTEGLCPSAAGDMFNTENWNSDLSMEVANGFEKMKQFIVQFL